MEIRAELKLRNAAVLRARKARGWSQIKLAEAVGIKQNIVSDVERMQFKRVRVREAAIKIAIVLELHPDAVLPPDMEEDIVAEMHTTKHVNVGAILAYADRFNSRMILPAPDGIEDSELSNILSELVNELPPRDREVITMRYGLGDSLTHTLQECGSKLNISRERTRQIEDKVIRKLQHPVRSNRLKPFVRNVEVEDITPK